MKLIGQGLFSKVYKMNETQVLIKSTCLVKECIANFMEDDNFPRLERTDNHEEYICEFYPKVSSLKNSLIPEHWKVYQELRKIETLCWSLDKNTLGVNEYLSIFQESSIDEGFKESIIELLYNLSNYGQDICFEISPRNVAVKDGKLILLDIFFFRGQAEEIRTSKRNR